MNPSTPKLAGRRKEGEEGGIHPGLRNRVCNLYTTKGKVRNLMYEFFHFGPATTSVVKPREREREKSELMSKSPKLVTLLITPP